ncbi:tryptophan-rich sensory protein [Iningainema tapete]|uniref:Tryptophan-rich sensory protein n=1 Tax=Iningainema tapete BLCC-T55 TaxID=2748662 RepID=A0A8J7BXJ8_9CYAN|nr:tryptophan-rich sensory protein [Iningainema tapete]MBD2773927.1 tryptophan-rich sensory protein [Iningainema tapete BLCC-T55]
MFPQSHSRSHHDLLRQLATLAAIVGAFVVNVLSNIFPFNGLSIGEISNSVFKNVLITPANYAFAIWGLIYLGLFAFGIYQVLPSHRHDSDLRKIGYFIVLACLAQIIWVYLFLARLFLLSVLAMLGILLPLIAVYLRLGIGINPVTRSKKWCVHIPISIYLGWIAVATVVNVACALYFLGWYGWGISAEVWTVIMSLVATAIAMLIIFQYNDIAYTGVTIWAILAIAIKNWQNPAIKIVTLAAAIALMLVILMRSLLTHNLRS